MMHDRNTPPDTPALDSARSRIRTLILGAAGRDFHDFNLRYRDAPATEVVAFTAAQIPGIAVRRYPTVPVGSRHPGSIGDGAS